MPTYWWRMVPNGTNRYQNIHVIFTIHSGWLHSEDIRELYETFLNLQATFTIHSDFISPPIRENNKFFPYKKVAKNKSVQNALKHVIKYRHKNDPPPLPHPPIPTSKMLGEN